MWPSAECLCVAVPLGAFNNPALQDSFSCSNDPRICDLISGAFLCVGPSALIAYSPIVQPANLNSPFIYHWKGNFREFFYGRDRYSFPTVHFPFIHSNRTRDLNEEHAMQNKDNTLQPPLQLDMAM